MAFVVENPIDKTGGNIAFDATAEEAVLVGAAKDHDRRAFEILVDRYRGKIFRTVQRFRLTQEDTASMRAVLTPPIRLMTRTSERSKNSSAIAPAAPGACQ